jgi:hypothetical protein
LVRFAGLGKAAAIEPSRQRSPAEIDLSLGRLPGLLDDERSTDPCLHGADVRGVAPILNGLPG